jgi:hypothetical protein
MRFGPAIPALASLAACADPNLPPGSASTTTGSGGLSMGPAAETTQGGSESPGPEEGTTASPNALPPTPQLESPADGATEVPIQTTLCWQPVVDPDGDALRYRVFVDDTELTAAAPGEPDPGYAGPCVGPLLFAPERTFSWRVQAFQAGDPERASDPSAPFAFTTLDDDTSHVVFADGFDDDLGWEVTGNATAGAWVRGNPEAAAFMGAAAQPGRCAMGDACVFTGHNAAGLPDADDVAGGSTVLTSPPFDLGGAATATVRLRRWFFRSEPGPAPGLQVELLVPDAAAPGGYQAHALEELTAATADEAENLWTPRELAACGMPMIDGSRLRITATDEGAGILEAAIDTVSVRAHDDATLCAAGEGGRCNPAHGMAACPGELLCCAQGTIHAGVYRCTPPALGLDFDSPPPTPESPNDGAPGCDAPDLTIDPSWIEPVLTDIFVSEDTCELAEACVGGTGMRTLLRFSVAIANVGSRDLRLGVAANHPEVFHYSECHDHYHFDDFASYELLDAGGIVATGRKQAFCLLDTYSWAWRNEQGTYDCANQGIGRGFADIYEADLPCQWIDVTDVPPGDYTLRATLNRPQYDAALPLVIERDATNNTVEVPVTL